MGATEAVIELGPGCTAAGMAEVLGILSSADCLGCTLAKGAAGADTDEEEGVDDDGVHPGLLLRTVEQEEVSVQLSESDQMYSNVFELVPDLAVSKQ